jgi:hypothetical protein
MLCAAAVCPQAPALVPEVGQGVAADLEDVRTAALAAIGVVVAAVPTRIIVLGDGGTGADQSAGGTLRGFGPDVRAGGPNLVLSPELTVGAWLLDAAGWSGPRTYASTLGAEESDRVGVIVLADGSARHRMLAPEWEDVEGRAFDATVAKALANGDPSALASLDVVAAAEFHAAGIGGLVELGAMTKGARIAAHVRYDGAPFDVGYWVADWQIER